MPEQQYPPYPSDTGALTLPRQLNRWIDVNPQGGALRRTETYLIIPVFTTTEAWNGYSDIVAAFNVEATNNFSLKLDFEAPDDSNYVLMISYQVDGIVTRYLLWDAEGSNIDQSVPQYTGQPILKNFRFEVWNTNQGLASNATAINLYTSVLNPIDYRFGVDTVLKNNDGQVTDFDMVGDVAPDYPFDINNFRGVNWVSTQNVSGHIVWTATNLINTITAAGGNLVTATYLGAPFPVVQAAANTLVGPCTDTATYLFFAFQASFKDPSAGSYVDELILYSNSYQCYIGRDGSLKTFIEVNVTTLLGSDSLVDGGFYLLVCVGGIQAFLINLLTQEVTPFTNIAGAIAPSTFVRVANSPNIGGTLEFLSYSLCNAFQTIYDHMFITYGGPFAFPLTFPDDSISTTN